MRIPNGEVREEEMVDPFYPERISLAVNVPNVFDKKTLIASFNVKQPKPPFILWQANRLLSN